MPLPGKHCTRPLRLARRPRYDPPHAEATGRGPPPLGRRPVVVPDPLMALLHVPPHTPKAPFRSRWTDEELLELLETYLETGSFPAGWDEDDAHRALTQAQAKWPQDFEAYLRAEGVSDARVAAAHRSGLTSSDAKAQQRAAETVHKLRGRMVNEDNAFKKGVDAALEIARILKGEVPVPLATIDVTPALPEGDDP